LGEEHHADSPVVEKATYAFGVDLLAFFVKRNGAARALLPVRRWVFDRSCGGLACPWWAKKGGNRRSTIQTRSFGIKQACGANKVKMPSVSVPEKHHPFWGERRRSLRVVIYLPVSAASNIKIRACFEDFCLLK
jgi:hypothetical protein